MNQVTHDVNPWGRAIGEVLKPKPRLTGSQWADRFRVVARGTSPEWGPWRTGRVPFMREILDAACSPLVERLWLQMASQVGKTELCLNVIGYFAHQDPSPILYVRETEPAAKSFSVERLEKMFRETPVLRGLLRESAREKGNKIEYKEYPGGFIAFGSARAASTLASRPIRILLMDEIDKYPITTGKDGDPIEQAEQRTQNFYNRKIIGVSTPTIAKLSPIESRYLASSQKRRFVPCPHCGAFQVLSWDRVKYKTDGGDLDFESARYDCNNCGRQIDEKHKHSMDKKGEWRSDNPGAKDDGYHISCLLSPWVKWADLARDWHGINKNKSLERLQAFINLKLGETWEQDSERILVGDLEGRNVERYNAQVPDKVLCLTCGVDVQEDRLELEVVGWGRGRESWGVLYAVLFGDTLDASGVWATLDALILNKRYTKADGTPLYVWATAIDSGYRTDTVYEYTRPRFRRNVIAVKGQSGPGKPIAGKVKKTGPRRTPLLLVGADMAKDFVFSRLKLKEPGPGFCHFPADPELGYDSEFFRSITAEEKVTETRGGRKRQVWRKVRERNEALDCRVYATAALEMLYPDLEKMEASRRGAGKKRKRKKNKQKSGIRL